MASSLKAPMPRTLFLYIMGRVARALGVAFLVVTSIIMLVDFVEANRDLSAEANISSLQLLTLTILKTPSLIEQTIPFVVLFGMMGAIHGMNRRSELIVMRASGQSAWSIVRPALWLAALFGLGWTLIFNPMAAQMYDRFESQTEQWVGDSADGSLIGGNIWLREGLGARQVVIRASSLDLPSRTLSDVTFLYLDRDADGRTQFARRFDADTATLLPQGYWQLLNVFENAPGEAVQQLEGVSLPTSIDQNELVSQADGAVTSGFWSLPGTIAENEAAGFSARDVRMQFNRLLSLPIMLIAMTFIAAGVSMSLAREGGTLRLLITGAALGFAVFFANSMVGAFGEVGTLPILLAAWSVPLVVLMLGISYLALIEDG